MNRVIFQSEDMETTFQKFGFVKVPLLSQEEVNQLRDFYTANNVLSKEGFQSTHFSKDRVYKRAVQNKIQDIFEDKLNALLHDYKFIFGNFMIKNVGADSRMPIHADWTYVNEPQFQSLGVWCSLVDTNRENGMLGVVPYSQNLDMNFRGPKIPSPFEKYDQYIIERYGKLIPTKAGEIIIYDHRLLHFSPPNLSNELRVAINIVVVPQEAEVYHYTILDKPTTVNKFIVSNQKFFVEYDHFEKPDLGKVDQVFPLEVPALPKKHIDQVLNQFGLLHLLRSIFKK